MRTEAETERIIREVVDDISVRYPEYPKPDVVPNANYNPGTMGYVPVLNAIYTSPLWEWSLVDEKYLRATVAHEMGHWHHVKVDPHKDYQLANREYIEAARRGFSSNEEYKALQLERYADQFAIHYLGEPIDFIKGLREHDEAIQQHYRMVA